MARLDANGTKREFVEAILRRDHYRMAVEANQPDLPDDLNRQFADLGLLLPTSIAARIGDKGYGWPERRGPWASMVRRLRRLAGADQLYRARGGRAAMGTQESEGLDIPTRAMAWALDCGTRRSAGPAGRAGWRVFGGPTAVRNATLVTLCRRLTWRAEVVMALVDL
ncbi:MAG: hypothetical protein M3R02_07225 [Chloroflexota bacterium]|nr:hypothetical protein [Chloroflexota bacterium]